MKSQSVIFTFLMLLSLLLSGCGNNDTDKITDQKTLTAAERSDYKDKGMQLVSETQKNLGSNLVKAINEGGTIHALEFCNIKAYPLTDSMATALKAHITRVTDQPRNPDNAATERQLTYIRSAKQTLASGNNINPEISVVNGRVTGYYPIITNQMCMQCHGNEKGQIDENTLAKIKELYPNDLATGYEVGDLRGIWVVEMDSL